MSRVDPQQSGQKKPYASPALRRLGTVRDLTLSGGTTNADTARTKKRM
ncbi:MAG TPA: lasso RiPP family leader peptide-containing protein [Polyangiaceae bacterium]|nr:lasso RiPP family leader peptide-containing protein [Polyangiaceae bacterium]